MTMSSLAAQIVQARRSGVPVPYVAALAAPDLPTAFAVQAEVAAALGERVAGWKVGFLQDGTTPWGAAIFESDMRENGGVHALAEGESVKVEAELGVIFARDLPPRPGVPYTRAEVVAAIGSVFAGIELVASRFANADDVPFVTRVADGFNNRAYVIGSGLEDFAGLELAHLRCRLTIGGEVCNDRLGGHANGDPLVPLVAWASQQADRLGGLRAGQFLTTGTLNVPVPLERAALIEAAIEGVGSARLEITQG